MLLIIISMALLIFYVSIHSISNLFICKVYLSSIFKNIWEIYFKNFVF